MNTFIDESGELTKPQNFKGNFKYNCITAIVLDDRAVVELTGLYANKSKHELRLDADNVISSLAANRCKAFAIIYDANLCDRSEIEKHKQDFIKSIYERIEEHRSFMSKEILESVEHHANKLSSVSNEQCTKALLMIKLLENILRGVSKQPEQFIQDGLTNFKFTCDMETDAIIPTIKYFVSFFVYCKAAADPIDIGNFELLSHLIHSLGKFIDGQHFFKDIQFLQSKDSIGIRMVDVLVNRLFRIMNREITDYDMSSLQSMFSNSFALDIVHFKMDQELIEIPLDKGDPAIPFIKLINRELYE